MGLRATRPKSAFNARFRSLYLYYATATFSRSLPITSATRGYFGRGMDAEWMQTAAMNNGTLETDMYCEGEGEEASFHLPPLTRLRNGGKIPPTGCTQAGLLTPD